MLAARRACPRAAEDTAATPLDARVKGFLEAQRAVGEPAAVRTLAGRRIEGTLVRLDPAPGHSFGEPVRSCSRSAASCARGWREPATWLIAPTPRCSPGGEIQRRAVGVDYEAYEQDGVAFDYEGLMASAGYGLDEVRRSSGRRRSAARRSSS